MFQTPFDFEGSCNEDLFYTWLTKFLLPQCEKGTYIIMDNHSIHKSERIEEAIKKHHCKLLFLPKYSPDLNPIEHFWHKIKSKVKKIYFKNKHENLDFTTVLSEALCAI